MKKGVMVSLGIILILLIGVVLATTNIKQDSNKIKKVKIGLEEFDLGLPSKNNPVISEKILDKLNLNIKSTKIRGDSSSEKVKVIITLRDPSTIPEWQNAISSLSASEKNSLKKSMRNLAIKKVETKKYIYSSFNGFSAELNQEELDILRETNLIERIEYDNPVKVFMQDTGGIINATPTWSLQIDGINLTGAGQTVCIIDTGVDYTHPDLGNCTSFVENQTEELPVSITSPNYPNNYPNNYYQTVASYNFSGADSLQLYFKDIDVEQDYDFIELYDGEDNLIWWYTGAYNNLWSIKIPGEEVIIKLYSDEMIQGNGFNITAIRVHSLNYSCEKIPGGWDFASGDFDPMDGHGHGTHVSGTVLATGNLKGIAPNSRLVSIRALDNGGNGYDSHILAGIDYCTKNSERYNISAISMSLGSPCRYLNGTPTSWCYEDFCDQEQSAYSIAINRAVEKNISVVIATGNDYNNTHISSPACIQNATRVGSSVKADNTLSTFSNRWTKDMLVAPGSSINSTKLGGGYISMQGTSMATPHVAGAIAIINQYLAMKSITKRPSEINQILKSTGKNISGDGRNYPRIDLYEAINQLNACSASWSNTTAFLEENLTDCRINDTILNNYSWIQYDLNNCLISLNTTFHDVAENLCDFCIPNWTAIEQEGIIWFNDTNDCFERTSLDADLSGRPLNITKSISNNITRIFNNETGRKILELNFNITYSSINNFSRINIKDRNSSKENTNFSFVIVKGLNLTENLSWNKTIYLDRILGNNLVCIKDSEIENISEISPHCNLSLDERLFNCPQTIGNYSCSLTETGYSINGLRNSAVREQETYCGDSICSSDESCSSCSNDCGSCPINSRISSSGGGGGSTQKVNSLKIIQVKDEQKISIGKGESIIFELTNKENHSLKVNSLNSLNVNITIFSEPINIILNVGKEERINLTNKYTYDLYLKLESVENNLASIILKEISEPMNVKDIPLTETLNDEPNAENTPTVISFDFKDIKKLGGIALLLIVAAVLSKRLYKIYEKNKIQASKKTQIKNQFHFSNN